MRWFGNGKKCWLPASTDTWVKQSAWPNSGLKYNIFSGGIDGERKMKTVSILVADDHEILRRGVCSLLETQDNWKILQAGDGHEAVLKTMTFRPDAVIMDIKMHGLNGLEAASQLRKELPNMPVILLSAYSMDEFIDRALATGVRGYVLKTDAERELISAVQAVLQGKTFFTPVISQRFPDHGESGATSDTMAVTGREVEVIRLLCEGKSNKEAASQLGISRRTVESHRAHIMEKLHLHSFSELIRYAIRNGIVEP